MIMEVIIMSVISGAGKSTLIKDNLPKENTKVVSADHFWIQKDGSYQFDAKRLREAHNDCMKNFILAEAIMAIENAAELINKTEHLVVDNTNIYAWELAPYVAVAQARGCPVWIVEIRAHWEKAYERNAHGVPEIVVKRMSENITQKLPWLFRELVEIVG